MTFLALDLGTDCGFAILKNGKYVSGTKKLQVDKREFGQRFLDFRNWLLKTITNHKVEHVYFERVYAHSGTEAAHTYGGFMYTLAAVCLEQGVKCTGLSVQTIKKFMTGKGNATKDEMILAARLRGFNPQSDDEADALAIILLGLNDFNAKNNGVVKNDLGPSSHWDTAGNRSPTFR